MHKLAALLAVALCAPAFAQPPDPPPVRPKDPATGTLLIATSTASKPALSVSPAVVNLTFRPPYPLDSIPLAVTTDGASVNLDRKSVV